MSLNDILMTELNTHSISVRSWKRSNSGAAHFDLGIIDIPRPTSSYTLGVAFHEIGHIVHSRIHSDYRVIPEYVIEYMAEQFAITKLKEYGLNFREYEAYATKYVMTCLSKYKNDGGDMHVIPAEISKWTGMDLMSWKVAKTVTVLNSPVRKKSDVQVKYSMS